MIRTANKLFINIIGVILLIAVMTTSCKVGPAYHSPDIAVADAFMYDSIRTHSTINLKWWELFNDDQLIQLVEIALVENKDIRIAAARVEEARAALGYTKADMLPAFGYSGNVDVTNMNPVTGETGGTYKSAMGGITLGWELDFWGKFRHASDAARAELLASEYGKRSIQMAIITEVVNAYFNLLANDNKLLVAKRTLESRQQSLTIISERFDKGIVGEIELNQAQMQNTSAAAAIPIYTRLKGQSQQALNILLGRNPEVINIGVELYDHVLPPDIPAGLPSDLLTRRPDIQQAEGMLMAQNERIGVAQAMRFPSISLTGMLGVVGPDLADFSNVWTAGGSILGPLFQFGKNKRRVEIEKTRYEQSLSIYEKTVITAFGEVENALLGIATYKEEYVARDAMVKAAANAAHLSKERYNGGVTSYLEVLDSERQLFNAELEAANTRRDQLISYIILYKALGGGWISESEK